MNKRKKGRSLGREKDQRMALMRTLLVSLIKHNKIKTTLAKARELQPFAERRISLAKRGLANNEAEKIAKIRLLKKDLPFESVKGLFSLAKTSKREGGCTRIVKLMSRKSDASKMAMIEWVDKNKELDKKQEKVITKPVKKVAKTAEEDLKKSTKKEGAIKKK